jgi:hypothetical protein
MTPSHVGVVQAMAATAALANGLFFFRFWRQSRDTLFGYFGAAFWLLALSWGWLAVSDPVDEARASIYALRLLAFVLMIVGMIGKNRS